VLLFEKGKRRTDTTGSAAKQRLYIARHDVGQLRCSSIHSYTRSYMQMIVWLACKPWSLYSSGMSVRYPFSRRHVGVWNWPSRQWV